MKRADRRFPGTQVLDGPNGFSREHKDCGEEINGRVSSYNRIRSNRSNQNKQNGEENARTGDGRLKTRQDWKRGH